MEKEPPPPYSPPPYSPPGSGYVPSHSTVPPTTVYVPMVFGPRPVRVTCPVCHETMVSKTSVEPNTKTHLWALLCCLLGCWPCFWVPYISEECLSKKHFCRNCKAFLGAYSD